MVFKYIFSHPLTHDKACAERLFQALKTLSAKRFDPGFLAFFLTFK